MRKPDPRSKPRVTFEDEIEEAQMTEGQPQSDYPQTAPSQPTVFYLDDNDAPTEQEIPITLDATHASMTVDGARHILIEHPLPKLVKKQMCALTNMSPRVGCLVPSQLAEKASLKQPSAFLWQ